MLTARRHRSSSCTAVTAVALTLIAAARCTHISTPEFLNAEFLAGAGKYFTVSADSIAYANQGFRVTVTAQFSGGSGVVRHYNGNLTFSVAGAGSISSATGGGWSNGTQVFTLIYSNASLSPGTSTQIAIKAQETGNAGVAGTSNNVTMNGPLNTIETVWQEDFESGLGNWTQVPVAGWTTVPSVNGVAMRSPVTGPAQNYTINTVNNIDLTAKTGCILDYDIQYEIGSASGFGTSVKLYFAGNVVGHYTGSTDEDFTSGGVYFPRRFYLGGGMSGKISLVTANGGGPNPWEVQDVRLDNMKISCNHGGNIPTQVYFENFENGSTDWNLADPWTLTSGAGSSGSVAPKASLSASYNAATYLTKVSNINLAGKSGCKLRFFQNFSNTCFSGNSLVVYWNTKYMYYYGGGNTYSYVEVPLSLFEGLSSNQLQFVCEEVSSCSIPGFFCAVDDVEVSCQF